MGTTPDYVAYINNQYPGRALFLIERKYRDSIKSNDPYLSTGIFADLIDTANVIDKIEKYLKSNNCTLAGVIGYDCEWLILAAELADYFDLPYPSVEAVRLVRDKYLAKKVWYEGGVRTPRTEMVQSLGSALRLTERFGETGSVENR